MKSISRLSNMFNILYIILPLYLVSCDNNVANNAGSVSNLQNSPYNADNPSSYQGSQAYSSSLLNDGEEVNPLSGTLTVSKSLISRTGITSDIDLNLNLIYSSSVNTPGILHLPRGWNYQLSYVIPHKSVNIDGNNYLLDDK